MAVKTINNRLSALSTVLRYAIDNGATPPPAVRLRCKIDSKTGEIDAVPMEHVEKLVAAATDHR